MPGLEGIIDISPILPGEAYSAARSIRDFLAVAAEGVHPDTAILMKVESWSWAESVLDLAAEIESSGRLETVHDMAYIAARNEAAPQDGIIGLGAFTRIREGVLISALSVAPRYRGRHIGPAILDAAFRDLDITSADVLTMDLAERDLRTRRFFERIGFVGHGGGPDFFPGENTIVHDYSALQPIVQASVRMLLRDS